MLRYRATWLAMAACACARSPAPGPKAAPPAAPPPPPAAVPEPPPLTRDECLGLIDHILTLGLADQRSRHPADRIPTADQIAAVRDRLVADHLTPCLALPRAEWACGLAAPTQAALYACAAPPAR